MTCFLAWAEERGGMVDPGGIRDKCPAVGPEIGEDLPISCCKAKSK